LCGRWSEGDEADIFVIIGHVFCGDARDIWRYGVLLGGRGVDMGGRWWGGMTVCPVEGMLKTERKESDGGGFLLVRGGGITIQVETEIFFYEYDAGNHPPVFC
jgi:hypothetical protein